jgi:hypothetical protein
MLIRDIGVSPVRLRRSRDSLLKGQPLQGKVTLKMKQELEELLTEGRFSPFVITTHDGFAIAAGEEARRHILLGARMVVIMDQYGNFSHIPYTAISHIDEVKPGR